MEFRFEKLVVFFFCCDLGWCWEHGCQFTGSYIPLGPNGVNMYDEIAWGDKRQIFPLKLTSQEQLINLQEKIQAAKRKVFASWVFDNVDLYLMPEHQNHHIGDHAWNKWYNDLNPRMSSRQDALGFTMKVFTELGKEYQVGDEDTIQTMMRVQDATYFAAVQKDLDGELIRQMSTAPRDMLPENNAIAGFVGVISVVVKGKRGYIIIDFDYFVGDVPFLQVDRLALQNGTESAASTFHQADVTYEFIGEHKSYIKYQLGDHRPKVMYVERPLCSIIHVANQMVHSSPFLTIGKMDKDGFLEAYIIARLEEAVDDEPYFYCQGATADSFFCMGTSAMDANGNWTISRNLLTTLKRKEMPADTRKFREDVINKILGISGPDAQGLSDDLKEELCSLDTFMRAYRRQYFEENAGLMEKIQKKTVSFLKKLPGMLKHSSQVTDNVPNIRSP